MSRCAASIPLTLPFELCVFDIDASLKKNSGALKFKESVTACGHTEHFTIEDLTDRVMADKLEIAEDGNCTTFTAEHDSDEEPFRSGDFNPQSPDDIFGAPLSLDSMTAVQRQHQVPRFVCLQYAAGTSSVELTLANGGKDNEKGGRNFFLGSSWNNYGDQPTSEDCQQKCLDDPDCAFVLFRPANRFCTKYTACTRSPGIDWNWADDQVFRK